MSRTMNSVTDSDDKPPLLGSWRGLYMIVIAELALLIIFLFAFPELFR